MVLYSTQCLIKLALFLYEIERSILRISFHFLIQFQAYIHDFEEKATLEGLLIICIVGLMPSFQLLKNKKQMFTKKSKKKKEEREEAAEGSKESRRIR